MEGDIVVEIVVVMVIIKVGEIGVVR